jgi:hypothetical protein
VIWRATLSHLDEIRKEETRIDAEEHTGDRRAHQTLQRHTSHIASPFVRADFLRKSAITQNEKARITVREQITQPIKRAQGGKHSRMRRRVTMISLYHFSKSSQIVY